MNESEFKSYNRKVFEENSLNITDDQLDKFWIYRNMLIEWSEKMNLTAILDDEGIIVKHFLDCAILLRYVDIKPNASLADVGSGAGFPAVVVKIMRPDIGITMIDSLNKRLIFLNELLLRLDLDGKTVHLRGEDAGRKPEFREKFDFATARAVAKMAILSEYCIPLLKNGGSFVALKGYDVEEEMDSAKSAVKLLGGEISNIVGYDLINDGKRSIISIKKISQTPTKFPRPTAKIAKNPI